MDKLNDDYQLKYAGLVLRDVARSGSAERCSAVLTMADEILGHAQQNLNVTAKARSSLATARYSLEAARKEIAGAQGGAA